MGRPKSRTLFFRLMVAQAACGIILLIMLACVQFWQALRPVDGGFDRYMRFHARVVAATLDEPDLASAFPHADVANVEQLLDEANGFDGRRVGVQVLGMHGELLHRSSHAPAIAFGMRPAGFHEIEVRQERWRVLVSPVEEAGVTLVVGERTSDRLARGGRAALGIAGPLLFTLPVVFLGGWLASRFAVRPLRQVVASISTRPTGDRMPIAPGRSVAEIEPLIEELNRLLERIQLAREMERDFFADAAHELKTPLAVVAMQAHLLATSPTQADRSLALADLERTLQRTSHLVNQLLALAAADNRMGMQSLEPVDLAELLAERLAAMAMLADENEVELALHAPDVFMIVANRESLVSLVDNLFDNALRYNRPGGKVEVSLELTSAGCELRVADTGIGIPPTERTRVFDRFYRVAGITAPGSGLGLSIVQATVERLHGTALIEGRTDGRPGTVFVVRLPGTGYR